MLTTESIVITLLSMASLIRFISGNVLFMLLSATFLVDISQHLFCMHIFFQIMSLQLDHGKDVCQGADPDPLPGQLQCLTVPIY